MICVQDCQREAELEKRIAELEEALRPFAKAWEHAYNVAPKATLGQLGYLCAYEVSGAHFQKALRVLDDGTN